MKAVPERFTFLLLLLLLLSIVWQNTCVAQVITILDESGQPLEMVTISSNGPMVSVTTDGNGKADITSLEGAEQVEIRMLGRETLHTDHQTLAETGVVVLRSVGLSLDQVVISASRWSQSKRDVPGRISTISSSEAALLNPQTAADLIAGTGEVFVQKSQLGGGSPMIRGFATNRVLIVVDGVRMNNAIFRSGNVQNIINIDPFTIEHTEVLFGPGSVIYGSDAIGGVMNFRTKEPLLSLRDRPAVNGNGLFRFSSASTELTGHADVNIGFRKFASFTSLSYSDIGDLRMGSHGPQEYLRPHYVERQDTVDVIVENDDPRLQRPTAYSQLNVLQKFRYEPDKHWDVNYTFQYSATSAYGRYDRHLRERAGKPRYAEWNYGPQVWMMNLFDVLHSSETTIYSEMNLTLAHQWFKESRISRDFQSDVRTTQTEQVQAYTLNLDLRKDISDRHTVYYGVEGVFNDVFSSAHQTDIGTGTWQPTVSRYPRSNWTSVGAYLSYMYRPIRKVTLQSGLRYNHFLLHAAFDTTLFPLPFSTAQLNNGALTGSLGVAFSPTEKWSLSINASTGFRSPNVDDIGKIFDSEPGSVVVPNPDLKAEYAYNVELGAAKVFGNWLKTDVSVYYTFLQNALVRRDHALNGSDSIFYAGELSNVQAIQNAAHAYVYGIQAGIELKFPKGFSVLSRFNYQKGEEELDDGTTGPLRHAGPWFGSTHLIYRFSSLKVDLYAIYNGKMSNNDLPPSEQAKPYIYATDSDGLPYSPAWYTLNLKLMYQFDEHLLISTGMENMTDQRYRPYSSGIAAPGINFILSVRAMF